MTGEEKALAALSVLALGMWAATRKKAPTPAPLPEGEALPWIDLGSIPKGTVIPPGGGAKKWAVGGTKGKQSAIVEEICRQWKVGQHKADWGAAHYKAIEDAIDRSATAMAREWSNPAEAREVAYQVNADALNSLCTGLKLPLSKAAIDELEQTWPFWMKELWARSYPKAWAKVTGQ